MVKTKTLLFVLIIFLLLTNSVTADVATSVRLTALGAFSRYNEDELAVNGLAKGKLSFKSTGNSNVKAQIDVDAIVTSSYMPVDLDISRAYVKVRFQPFRIMVGRNRLSWGEGFMFNAGDVIFGSRSPQVADFTESVLRDETDWLFSPYIPLGQFSYLEGVFLPFPQEQEYGIMEILAGEEPEQVIINECRGGGRLVTKLLDVKLEAGYLFKADQEIHHPYASLQGSLYFDWNVSASLAIPHGEPEEEDLKDGFYLSMGLFRIFDFEGGDTVTFRIESMLKPYGEWEEVEEEEEEPEFPPGPPPQQEEDMPPPEYGLYLYPELVWAAEDTLSFQLRSIISPVDISGLIMLGMNWNIYQGFSILSYFSIMFGEEDDLFGWERDRDISYMLGFEFIY